MYVILSQDIPKLGSKNSLVNVSKGYYANFLYPRGFANRATSDLIEKMKETIVEQKQAADAAVKGASLSAMKLNAKTITVIAKANKKGTLFKSIAEKTIAKDIMKAFEVEVDPKNIEMDHIKDLGDHSIKIKFGDEIVGMKVVVEAEADKK